MATAARRVRLSRHGKKAEPVDTSNISLYIDEIMKLDEKNAANNVKRQGLVALIEGLMVVGKLKEVTSTKGIAEYVTPTSNSKTVIDPLKFRKAVKDDAEFYGSITVGVAQAKKILPEKALAKISTVTSGEEKAPVLVVKPLTSKKKK